MTNRDANQRKGVRPRAFARSEEGSISLFAIFMVLLMVMLGGIGADLMRHEMERMRIQSVADRAVLAAADLDQTLDPETVVRDYFTKSGMENFVSNVIVDEGLNYRTVTVDASATMPTQFIDILGHETLPLPALSTAEEKINKVEISLVLDISGSMRSNDKMDNLHDAAGAFLDAVLKPENADLISVNVIPYTAQVNVGWDIFRHLNITPLHDYSYCVDFTQSDFDQAYVDLNEPYEHMQHFDSGYNWSGNRNEDTIDNPGCPKRSYERVQAFSQDKWALKNTINQFRPRANTAIHLGMKWGVAMLDPRFNDITKQLPNVDAVFDDRPASYDDRETMKTVILMTDGENVTTYRINDSYYANYSHRRHWSIYPLGWYLNNYVRSWDHNYWRQVRYSPYEADNMLEDICDAAKRKNIVIWSIGPATSSASRVLKSRMPSRPSPARSTS
ncbi:MAG: pilus assembly protein TadG-related protein [Sulfitobacter sp.]|nr:pilus assembly protein TadG-related protein [Sulfitobacter sp.]